jgi:hypothetical protein
MEKRERGERERERERERGVVHNINRETSYRMSFHPMSFSCLFNV